MKNHEKLKGMRIIAWPDVSALSEMKSEIPADWLQEIFGTEEPAVLIGLNTIATTKGNLDRLREKLPQSVIFA